MTLMAWAAIHGFANLALDGQLRALGLDQADSDALADQIAGYAFAGLRRKR